MPLTTYTAGEVLTAASLNANLVFAAANPVSSVVQVKSAGKANSFSTASATFVDITDLTISITPTSATNKVLVILTLQGSNGADGDAAFRLMRDSTAIALSTAGSTTNGVGMASSTYSNSMFTVGVAFLDSPATTSATTYKAQALAAAATTYVNRRGSGTTFGGFSSITVMEVTP